MKRIEDQWDKLVNSNLVTCILPGDIIFVQIKTNTKKCKKYLIHLKLHILIFLFENKVWQGSGIWLSCESSCILTKEIEIKIACNEQSIA